MGEIRNGDQKVRKYLFFEIFYGRQEVHKYSVVLLSSRFVFVLLLILMVGSRSVCVCVFFPFILDIKFVGRTSRGHTGGRSHRISHPPSSCGACLYFSREKDSDIPFSRRPLSRILCTNDLIVLHPLGILF